MKTTPFSANNAFYLLFITSFGALVLLIGLLSKLTPLTIDHTVYFCKQAINSLSFSLPHSFPSLSVLTLSSVFSIGLLLLIIQVIKTNLIIRKILKSKIRVPSKIRTLVGELGIAESIDVVKTDQFFSFCYGFFKPRICLDLNLTRSLTNKELKAVLIHEKYHLKNRDPLKILLSQTVVSMFFFIPSLRDFHKHYSLSKEIYADQLVQKTAGVKNLRSALIKNLSLKTSPIMGVTSFVKNTDVEQRFGVLVNPSLKIKMRISYTNTLVSGFVFLFALILLNLPVHAMENEDGSHSYYIMSQTDKHMVSCIRENTTSEFPFSSQELFSPVNYSPNH